jgi:RNA recognition motif-containing protein
MGESEYRCFVGGLAWATTDNSLEEAFRSFGEVTQCKVITDRETGRSRGFGFVTFSDETAMLKAIDEMSGKELDGRNITVNQAQSRSGGGERSGVVGVTGAEAAAAMAAAVLEAVMEVEVMGTVNVAAAAAVMEVVEVAAMEEVVVVMVEAVVGAVVVLAMGTGETVTSQTTKRVRGG